MNEPNTPAIFDKRLAKGIIKGELYEYMKTHAKYLLAFSPKIVADDLDIGEPSIQPVWILAGSFEIEDRKLELSYAPTTEKQPRGPQADEPDLFRYPVLSDATRSEHRELLPSREAVVTCFKCSGKGQLVEDCEYCQGSGRLACDICDGKGHRLVVCSECHGTGGIRGYGNPDEYPCRVCLGPKGLNGFVREPCKACNETGRSHNPCPNCADGKTRRPCPECQGVGYLLQKTVLWTRSRTLRIQPQLLDPEIPFPLSATDMMEHMYTTPPLPLKDLRTHPHPLSPQVWERVATRLAETCTSAIQKSDDETSESQVKSIQASVYRASVAYAQFQYQERFGSIWVALGSNGRKLDSAVTLFPVQFSVAKSEN